MFSIIIEVEIPHQSIRQLSIAPEIAGENKKKSYCSKRLYTSIAPEDIEVQKRL